MQTTPTIAPMPPLRSPVQEPPVPDPALLLRVSRAQGSCPHPCGVIPLVFWHCLTHHEASRLCSGTTSN